MPHRLDPLLRPRSIAVLGATERAGTVGRTIIGNLQKGSYTGPLSIARGTTAAGGARHLRRR
jgi:acyl-CoA synthetase (NDP forming)